MPYTGPKIDGDINEEGFWKELHEKMSDLAKHTPNQNWSQPMAKVAEGAFELAQLHANQPTMEAEEDDPADDWKAYVQGMAARSGSMAST